MFERVVTKPGVYVCIKAIEVIWSLRMNASLIMTDICGVSHENFADFINNEHCKINVMNDNN